MLTALHGQHLSTKTNGVVSTLRYSTANSAFYWGYISTTLDVTKISTDVRLKQLPCSPSRCSCSACRSRGLSRSSCACRWRVSDLPLTPSRRLLWGVTVILTVVAQGYKGLIIQRVFLGVLEVRFADDRPQALVLTEPYSLPYLPDL